MPQYTNFSEEMFESDPGHTPPADLGANASEASDLADSQDGVASADGVTPSDAPAKEEADENGQDDLKADADSKEVVDDDQQHSEEEEITDESIDKALAEAESGKKIKPRFYEKSLNHLKNKLGAREAEINEYTALGDKEKLSAAVELYDSFSGFNEVEGQLVPRSAEFAQMLVEKEPQKAIDIANTVLASPNPANPSETLFEAVLNSEPIKAYLAERFQAEADPVLSEVPDEFKEAYQALPNELKETFKLAKDDARQTMLNQSQQRLEQAKTEMAKAEAQRAADEQAFNDAVEATTNEHLTSVSDEFAKSLEQITFSSDASLNGFQQVAVQDMIGTAATMAGTPAGDRAVKALQSVGVTFPPDVPTKIAEIEGLSKKLVLAQKTNNAGAISQITADIATAKRQLIARSNEIAAAIGKKFGTKAQESAEEKAKLLASNQTRPSIDGNGNGGQPHVRRYTEPEAIFAHSG